MKWIIMNRNYYDYPAVFQNVVTCGLLSRWNDKRGDASSKVWSTKKATLGITYVEAIFEGWNQTFPYM